MGKSQKNLQEVRSYFDSEMERIGYNGVLGVAEFKKVYDELMPIQRKKIRELCEEELQNFIKNGSIISLGIAYPEYAIDCINVKFEDGTTNKNAWNIYAREYHKLNEVLNNACKDLSESYSGISIPATIEGIASEIENVEEYYGMTISHRVIAENAGLGWRGKNELIVNDTFSCALRFASVLTTFPLPHENKVENLCGLCDACLKVCPFLENKEKLDNYREGCRRYIDKLALDGDVCGKCVKACYRQSIFAMKFKLF